MNQQDVFVSHFIQIQQDKHIRIKRSTGQHTHNTTHIQQVNRMSFKKPYYKYSSSSSKKTLLPKQAIKSEWVLTKEYCDILHEQQAFYVGQRGYTLLKTYMSPEDINQVKKDLFKIPRNSVGKPNPEAGFPLYRENDKKLYVPRFYGLDRYGTPYKSELSEGDPIDASCEFVGTLLPHQIEAIRVYRDHLAKNETTMKTGGILELPCGYGKTVLTIKIIVEMGGKTIILVHKEFLMNQWIERIRQFLPQARIGILQGHKCELVGTDIVIGMIQSIYNRDFAPGSFDAFRLTVIDEVHRIGSGEFSKTLTKIPTKYMLGISATVERKDGLTDILYMHIGPKIHSIKRANDDFVMVRAIEYLCNDADFNTVEYDYTGRVKHSTMISKLCSFGPRSDFIVRIIRELFQENPQKQMIVLCHNRCLLVYLHDVLTGPLTGVGPTVGYYVGGMKQTDLAISETKQVVLATYAMAAEALDIKSLSTLLLVSPKTDIIQSVGRILRTKHNNPLIVDLVDSHACFQNQWAKRRQYYKKCNYKIVKTLSTEYPVGWRTLFEPAQEKQVCQEGSDEEEGDPMYNIDDIVF